MNPEQLPVPVLLHPHWRVNFKPLQYSGEGIRLAECLDAVTRAQVHLRGWDYPHISRHKAEFRFANNYIASWSSFGHNIEYWRFYQSTQFLHLFVIQEAVSTEWDARLRGNALYDTGAGELDRIPAFFSIDNFLYTITEVFEFAARLTIGGLYSQGLSVSIKLNQIGGFALSFSSDRPMLRRYQANADSLENVLNYSPEGLISGVADAALEASVWFFERFGWLNPPTDTFRKDIQNYLAGRW